MLNIFFITLSEINYRQGWFSAAPFPNHRGGQSRVGDCLETDCAFIATDERLVLPGSVSQIAKFVTKRALYLLHPSSFMTDSVQFTSVDIRPPIAVISTIWLTSCY